MKHLQTLLLAAALTGCTDQLALIQDNCRGMWRLESRRPGLRSQHPAPLQGRGIECHREASRSRRAVGRTGRAS